MAAKSRNCSQQDELPAARFLVFLKLYAPIVLLQLSCGEEQVHFQWFEKCLHYLIGMWLFSCSLEGFFVGAEFQAKFIPCISFCFIKQTFGGEKKWSRARILCSKRVERQKGRWENIARCTLLVFSIIKCLYSKEANKFIQKHKSKVISTNRKISELLDTIIAF